MTYLRVKNWERFQHYHGTKRRMHWLRLDLDFPSDYAVSHLPDSAKYHLVGLFILAGRTDNRIPADPEYVKHELHASEPVDIQLLIASGFIEYVEDHASKPLADCAQPASNPLAICAPTDRQTDRQTSDEHSASKPLADDSPPDPFTEFLSTSTAIAFTYPKLEAELRALVGAAGWPEARRLIDQAVAKGVGHPVAYALKVHTGEAAKAKIKSGSGPPIDPAFLRPGTVKVDM